MISYFLARRTQYSIAYAMVRKVDGLPTETLRGETDSDFNFKIAMKGFGYDQDDNVLHDFAMTMISSIDEHAKAAAAKAC